MSDVPTPSDRRIFVVSLLCHKQEVKFGCQGESCGGDGEEHGCFAVVVGDVQPTRGVKAVSCGPFYVLMIRRD